MKVSLKKCTAFTLIELLVSMAVLTLIMVVLLGVTEQTSRVWRQTTGKIEQFREAREGFEAMTRRLGQATLNTFWDYDDSVNPTRYLRQSELRFISGDTTDMVGGNRSFATHGVFFQAPLGFTAEGSAARGLELLLNTWGYFIEFEDNRTSRPDIITDSISPPKYRFRLYELMQPSDDLGIYSYTSGVGSHGKPNSLAYDGKDWFSDAMNVPNANRPARPIAENIIALIILPKLSAQEDPTKNQLAPNYTYDSTVTRSDDKLNPKNQLPPVLQVTMVAIDEASAIRLENGEIPPEFGLGNLFQPSGNSASKFQSDLQTLENTLRGLNVSYRIFTTNVSIAGAKWSTEQEN